MSALQTRVVFSTTEGWISRLIRRVTGSRCSHCCWLYWDADFKIDMIMEAHETGYRIVTWDSFKKHNTVIKVVVPVHSVDVAMLHSIQWLGTMYDFKGLFGNMIVRIGRFFKRKWHNPFASKTEVVCSEAMTRGLLFQGYPKFSLIPDDTGPDELLEFFEAEVTRE